MFRIAKIGLMLLLLVVFSGSTQAQQRTVRFEHLSLSQGLSQNTITSMLQDQQGFIWFGTQDGLNRYDGYSFTIYRHKIQDATSLTNNYITSIQQDTIDTLWIGTNGGGLNRFDLNSQSFTVYRNDPKNPNSISNNVITAVYRDNSGMLWVGTDGGGLNRFDPNSQSFIVYRNDPKNPNSISSNVIYSIFEDRTGTLWIGTLDGLNRFDPSSQSFTVYRNDPKNPNSISSNVIYSIFEDHTGVLWIGTDGGGLNRFDPNSQSFIVYRNDPKNPNSISSNVIYSIFEDRTGTLWIGTLDGLNRFDPSRQSFTVYRNDPENSNSISNNAVWVIHEDRAGILWIGTLDGLNRFDANSQSFTVYRNDPKNPNSISSNMINTIYQDSNGILWIGTLVGLNRFNPQNQTFVSFTEKDGLSTDTVFGVLADKNGNLWLSTNRGLSKFNPQTKKFRNYNIIEGLQSNEFNALAYHQSSSGEIFFGGINGFTRFYPEQVTDKCFIPPIVITAFNLSDHPVLKENLALIQNLLLTKDRFLEISYKESFSFEFAALNFTHPERNRYAYKLEGFDKDWIYCGTRRFVRYANLDPGEYVFRVKGSNNDGFWNEVGTAVKIRIVPPLWRTWWAYLLYLITLMSAGYAGYRYRLKILEQRLQIEKAAELEAKNRELFSMNQELIELHKRADRIFSALAEALPGTVLDGKYRLDEKIGSGGFGAVYRGTHLAMKRPIAVKIFKPTPGNDSAEGLNRFLSESVSASRINHPNAVMVLDSGISSEGIAYLVMELLVGHTLTEELHQKGALSLGRAAQILYPVCSVLSKAHQLGIIHRDIKPDNIFLHQTLDGEIVKVVDFGIAKLIESDGNIDINNLTATGRIIGTPVYIAPERLEGRAYDGQSDIYSLGIVLYEMLCGRLPFSSPRDIFVIIHLHLTKLPQPLREINPSIPEAVETLVLRALSKGPEKRPTAKEFGEEFLIALGIEPDKLTANTMESIGPAPEQLTMGRNITSEQMHDIKELFNLLVKYRPNERKTLLEQTSTENIVLRKTIETLILSIDDQEDQIKPERWQQVEKLFYQLLEIEPAQRAAFLDKTCLGDTALRRKVEALIVADEELAALARVDLPVQ
ncbi:MAG: two-component regulator propeller domain-containing protein [Acidobacteriota bacterium]